MLIHKNSTFRFSYTTFQTQSYVILNSFISKSCWYDDPLKITKEISIGCVSDQTTATQRENKK